MGRIPFAPTLGIMQTFFRPSKRVRWTTSASGQSAVVKSIVMEEVYIFWLDSYFCPDCYT
jgi:hypothetical protein